MPMTTDIDPPDAAEPRPITLIGDFDSHDTLLRILARDEPCKVLDIPCGKGPLTQYMLDFGWDVHAADIDRGLLLVPDVPFTEVNLNQALPFEDESFDALVCANGLHRIYNPGGAIKEFHRLLRPGGRLYINANNFASIGARLRFLIGGSMDTRLNEGGAQQTIDNIEANVRFCLLYPQIANNLTAAGFEIDNVRSSAVRLRHRLLTPFAWLIRLAAYLIPPGRRQRDHLAESNGPGVFPGGRYFVIESHKPA